MQPAQRMEPFSRHSYEPNQYSPNRRNPNRYNPDRHEKAGQSLQRVCRPAVCKVLESSILQFDALSVTVPLRAVVGAQNQDAFHQSPDACDGWADDENPADDGQQQLCHGLAGVAQVEVVHAEAAQEDAKQTGCRFRLLGVSGRCDGLAVCRLLRVGGLGVGGLVVKRGRVALLSVVRLIVIRLGVSVVGVIRRGCRLTVRRLRRLGRLGRLAILTVLVVRCGVRIIYRSSGRGRLSRLGIDGSRTVCRGRSRRLTV